MHRVAIRIAPENNASVAVAERLGFTREAVLREDQLLWDVTTHCHIRHN